MTPFGAVAVHIDSRAKVATDPPVPLGPHHGEDADHVGLHHAPRLDGAAIACERRMLLQGRRRLERARAGRIIYLHSGPPLSRDVL